MASAATSAGSSRSPVPWTATPDEGLLETANTANTVQSPTASPDHHTVDLVTVAREAADRARESFPEATVVCQLPTPEEWASALLRCEQATRE